MALPTHRLSIFKRNGNEVWSNDWLLNVPSMAEGATVADALIVFERKLHPATTQFEYYRLSTMAEGDRTFRHVPVNLAGQLDMAGGDGLPLFCTVRMDMSTQDSDPCRKYFRGPVPEGWQNNGALISTAIASINTIITTNFVNSIALDNVVSGKGNVVTGATCYPYVQMRQLNRRKRPSLT